MSTVRRYTCTRYKVHNARSVYTVQGGGCTVCTAGGGDRLLPRDPYILTPARFTPPGTTIGSKLSTLLRAVPPRPPIGPNNLSQNPTETLFISSKLEVLTCWLSVLELPPPLLILNEEQFATSSVLNFESIKAFLERNLSSIWSVASTYISCMFASRSKYMKLAKKSAPCVWHCDSWALLRGVTWLVGAVCHLKFLTEFPAGENEANPKQ